MPKILFVLLVLLIPGDRVARATPATAPITGDALLQYLNDMIDWHHRIDALDTASSRQSQELLLRDNVRDDAAQAVRLAFVFARSEAAAMETTNPPAAATHAGEGAGNATRASNLAQVAAAVVRRAADLQARLNQLNQELATTRPVDRSALAARRDRLQAQINLTLAQQEVMQQYAGFVFVTQGDAASLSQRISELRQSVPEIPAQPPSTQPQSADEAAATAAAAQAPAAASHSSRGILALLHDLFAISGQMSELSRLSKHAATLAAQADQFRAPIRAEILDTIHRADALAATTQSSDDPAAMDAQRRQIEELTARFKTLAAAGVPLGEQRAVLDAATQQLKNWRDLLSREYRLVLQELLVHLAAVALTVLLLIFISALWRRATYRYIADVRRRRQLMLVRRIVIAVVVVVIIIANVVSEFGSLATFAGLITAGIAVALQTVILSGVAYFFFIGRFGVRVGDRVTISGITGDVIEIGIFRLYLMELSGNKSDLHRTGRIVVFSNSVLFQPSAFYKQMPGANYAWREINFTLSPMTDYNLAEKRLLAAVEPVFAEYRDRLETQQAAVSQSLHVPVDPPRPQGRLRIVNSDVEFVLRYPVELGHASEIDDSIARKILETMKAEPNLNLISNSMPAIRPAT